MCSNMGRWTQMKSDQESNVLATSNTDFTKRKFTKFPMRKFPEEGVRRCKCCYGLADDRRWESLCYPCAETDASWEPPDHVLVGNVSKYGPMPGPKDGS